VQEELEGALEDVAAVSEGPRDGEEVWIGIKIKIKITCTCIPSLGH